MKAPFVPRQAAIVGPSGCAPCAIGLYQFRCGAGRWLAMWFCLLLLCSSLKPQPAQAGHGIGTAVFEVHRRTTNAPVEFFTATRSSNQKLRLRWNWNHPDYAVVAEPGNAAEVPPGEVISCMGGPEDQPSVVAGFFPYRDWLAGSAGILTSSNGSTNTFCGAPGLAPGTHFIPRGAGEFVVDLTSHGVRADRDGILLVTTDEPGAVAHSSGNAEAGTWSVKVVPLIRGVRNTIVDQMSFVFVPKTNQLIVSGRFSADGRILLHSGATPRFAIQRFSPNRWQLTISGQSPRSGVLLISPEVADRVSYQAEKGAWMIECSPERQISDQAPLLSFAFIPIPTATRTSAAPAVNRSPTAELQVQVTPGLNGASRVTFFGRELPPPNNPNTDFTIVALPDTQFYSATMKGGLPAMFQAQTDWVVANRTNLNVQFVTHLGDITQRGQNRGRATEWLVATNAMYRLEDPVTTLLANGIPYGLGVGNHDQTPIGGGNTADTSFFNQFFGAPHFSGYDYYGGHFGTNNNNSFQFFRAGGMDFIFLHLEYDTTPEATVLAWADQLLKQYPQHRAIVTSHWIVNRGWDATFGPQGRAIYQQLRQNPNFFLMLCGHIGGEGQRTDTHAGQTVYSILTDYQSRTNGGDGWLRYYTFSPRNNLIRAYTYSPWLKQFETDADSQFTLHYNMNLSGPPDGNFAALATDISPVNEIATRKWAGLQSGHTYEWYVETTDADGNISTSPTWVIQQR